MTTETECNDALIEDINEAIAEQDIRLESFERRLERLEQYAVASKAAAIIQSRTRPASPEASAKGLVADEQTALINARASERRHTPVQPVGVPGYGRRA